MTGRDRRVVFGRINRRTPEQGVLQPRDFALDMVVLADSHKTVHTVRSMGGRPGRRWVAADMTVTPDGDFQNLVEHISVDAHV
jgi:DNA-binding cell septation regulator SpoVG